MANKLTRQQMVQTWQGMQGMLFGMPGNQVPTDQIDRLSDAQLRARIDLQIAGVDRNGAIRNSRTPAFNQNGNVPHLPATLATPPGARNQAIQTLRDGLTNKPDVDLNQFHAIIAGYSDEQDLTVPDLKFDDKISEHERAAAERILQRLEAGEMAPAIRQSFQAQGQTIQQQQRAAAEEAARQAAQQAEAARRQQNLHESVDAHFAGMGYIKPEEIGKLTAQQRANHLTRFMRDNHIAIQMQNTESSKLGNLHQQQRAAIDMSNGYGVNNNALTILQSGRRHTHMAEEVRTWLESGDARQIMMAQATMGAPVTGALDSQTQNMGLTYVRQAYATNLNDLPFVRNVTGTINPSLMWQAANNGQLYIPSIAELRTAGVSEDQLSMLEGTKTSAELRDARAGLQGRDPSTFTPEERAIWVSDTREELIANMYMDNPQLYTQVIQNRNQLAATATLNLPAAYTPEQQADFNQRYEDLGTAGTNPNVPVAQMPQPVRLMIEAQQAVERAEDNYRTAGGPTMTTNPQTGRPQYVNPRQEAQVRLDTAQGAYERVEQDLRRDGIYDQVMQYVRDLKDGKTPTWNGPADKPQQQEQKPGETKPEDQKISGVLDENGKPKDGALFKGEAERGRGTPAVDNQFAQSVAPITQGLSTDGIEQPSAPALRTSRGLNHDFA